MKLLPTIVFTALIASSKTVAYLDDPHPQSARALISKDNGDTTPKTLSTNDRFTNSETNEVNAQQKAAEAYKARIRKELQDQFETQRESYEEPKENENSKISDEEELKIRHQRQVKKLKAIELRAKESQKKLKKEQRKKKKEFAKAKKDRAAYLDDPHPQSARALISKDNGDTTPKTPSTNDRFTNSETNEVNAQQKAAEAYKARIRKELQDQFETQRESYEEPKENENSKISDEEELKIRHQRQVEELKAIELRAKESQIKLKEAQREQKKEFAKAMKNRAKKEKEERRKIINASRRQQPSSWQCNLPLSYLLINKTCRPEFDLESIVDTMLQ